MTFPDPKIWKCHFFVVSLQQNLTLVKGNFGRFHNAEAWRLQGILDHA